MSENSQPKHPWTATILPICSMAVVAGMLISFTRITSDVLAYRGMATIALLVGPAALLGSVLLSRRRLRFVVAAVGAILPLPWIFMTEARAFGNSWVAMNASWKDPDSVACIRCYSQFRILSVALLLVTLIWALTRLLPSHWKLRSRPVNQRTWPAIAITLIFIVCWFARFAFPYRQPVIVDAMQPDLSILHVAKDGITFHETRISVYRDSRYSVFRNDRELFHYSFVETVYEGLLTDNLRSELKAVKALPELKRTLDKAPRALRARHGEGWYTEMGTFAITAFTTENATPAPAELRAFFREVEGAPSIGPTSQWKVRDVCLGFCYDPKAGLGYRAENERCTQRPDGKEICY